MSYLQPALGCGLIGVWQPGKQLRAESVYPEGQIQDERPMDDVLYGV